MYGSEGRGKNIMFVSDLVLLLPLTQRTARRTRRRRTTVRRSQVKVEYTSTWRTCVLFSDPKGLEIKDNVIDSLSQPQIF